MTNEVYENRNNYGLLRWPGKRRARYHWDCSRLVPEAQGKVTEIRLAAQEELEALEGELELLTRSLVGGPVATDNAPIPAPPPSEASIRAEIAMYQRALKAKAEKERIELKEYDSARAAKAAYEGRTREEAAQVRRQLDVPDECPYCAGELGEGAHADHIYPVSRGGQSTVENMVLVRSSCNMAKGDKTLREFIESAGLNRGEIESRLERLGKVF